MGYVVFHLDKSPGNESAMTDHIERKVIHPNVDPERIHLNKELVEFSDGVKNRTEAIQHRLDTAGLKRQIGKNQVKVIRVMISGSPEDMKRIESEGKLDDWCRDNMDYLKKTFGEDNLVAATLHMDETTPHIHASIVPIVIGERRQKKPRKKPEEDNPTQSTNVKPKRTYKKKDPNRPRLCVDDVMARDKLIEYQDTYAEAMAKYGLERGIKGSDARHITLTEHYRNQTIESNNLQINIEQLLAVEEAKRQRIEELKQQEQEAKLKSIQAVEKKRQKESELKKTEESLNQIKGQLKTEELKNKAADVGSNIIEGIGLLVGTSKVKKQQQEIENLKHEKYELQQDIEGLTQTISRERSERQQETMQLKSEIRKIHDWLPDTPTLIKWGEHCQKIGFSSTQARDLINMKPIRFSGELYSTEHSQRFAVNDAEMRFDRGTEKSSGFRLLINGINLNQWFRQKYDEFRAALGYFPPLQDHLIDIFCGKPYINVACSLLSLTPNNVSANIRQKILKHGLCILENNKYLHDKIEFEIALSSMYINYEQLHIRLKEYNLSDSEIIEYVQGIQDITCNMITNQRYYIKEGERSLENLQNITNKYKSIVTEEWNNYNIFAIINELIDKTKNWGVFHFSILARMAFIGDHLTKQLLNEGFLTDAQYHSFYSSINTIPDKINMDIQNVNDGILSKEDFLKQYGHLRISTYNIESPQYYEIYDGLLESQKLNKKTCDKENLALQFFKDKVLLDYTIEDILAFTRNAIEYREIFKYEFTKTVSFILEALKKIAVESNIRISEFAYLQLEDFYYLDNREKEGLHNTLIPLIKSRKDMFDKSVFVKLPDVISDYTDFYYFEEITAKPNFVTSLSIMADVLYFDIQSINKSDLDGKIILKETMEPGCDWIFLYPIAGIITKFGGVASHIAIRCRELNIPAVIGCGNYFDVLKNAEKIKIDSLNQKIYPFYNS